ncbi:protein NUCLEAR FUSION DEFECTIVE 6, mitochondrial-like [Hibiscus syriacus]|uniref:protein NUCLEAR FUSION DEFECTIVE 6, mitochondrial-like n=1 Tax=Hibiscus syriacus TaxID=106335 RepID=UPI0019209F83|nr:protein NUCLEAR FUSION DEFECTIVE 6, mitochondrial-like [Hibiscus syriacus]
MTSFGVAVRSIFRSSSARNAASRLALQFRAAPSSFRVSSRVPLSNCIFKFPVESSFCLESMLSYHSAIALALMTSMLTVSRSSAAWFSEGQEKTR